MSKVIFCNKAWLLCIFIMVARLQQVSGLTFTQNKGFHVLLGILTHLYSDSTQNSTPKSRFNHHNRFMRCGEIKLKRIHFLLYIDKMDHFFKVKFRKPNSLSAVHISSNLRNDWTDFEKMFIDRQDQYLVDTCFRNSGEISGSRD